MSYDYKQAVDKLREFCDFCHSNNTDEYIEMPELVVMGDTSSGKTSLLSAITQVQLPSNEKMTTRCPMRIRMEKREDISATVGIKWDADSSYGETELWPRISLSSWCDVPDHIAAAQALILKLSGTQVAKDVIEINVYGPDCTDLTLTDLPGTVRVVGAGESTRLIDDINQLNEFYLDNERCVIIPVHAATSCFHNSEILGDAQKKDPGTLKTLPVITKPDLIDKGAEGGTRDLLENKDVFFAKGFHMVKCRNQQALIDKVSMQAGLESEAEFFRTAKPWKDMDQSMFGVVNLRAKLSALQVSMMQESIPAIASEIRTKIQIATARLDLVGSLITTDRERRTYFANVTKSLMQLIAASLKGDSLRALCTDGDTFPATQEAQFNKFRDDIMSERLANMDEIEEDDVVTVTLDDGTLEQGTVYAVINTAGKMTYIVNPSSEDSSILGEQKPYPVVLGGYTVGDICTKNGIYYKITKLDTSGKIHTGRSIPPMAAVDIRRSVDWLSSRIAAKRSADLPCFLNAAVFNSIVMEMVTEDWVPLCKGLLEKCKSAYLQLVRRAVEEDVPRRYPSLHRRIGQIVEAVTERLFSAAEKRVDDTIAAEMCPYTQNHYLCENIIKMRDAPLQNRLLKMVTGKADGIAAIIKAAFNDVEKMSMEEHIAHEMQIVLNAYGKVAAKRVIDNVPMNIRKELKPLNDDLDRALQMTDAELAGLMVEDVVTINKIKKDTAEKKALEMAEKKLEELRLL